MKYPKPLLRSANALSRWSSKRQRLAAPKLVFLRDVFRDFRALRTPKLPLWGRIRARPRPTMPAPQNGADLASDAAPRVSSPPSPTSAFSRRQKLWGMARATKDTYISRITTSVSLIASGVARPSDFQYDELGSPIAFPQETTFTLFPSYTRPVSAQDSPTGKDGYLVNVRGWMWCPGVMSRKNRLVLSLAKQIAKSRGAEAAQHAVERLNSDPDLQRDAVAGDNESISSVNTSASSSSSSEPSSVDSLIKERLGSFIARSIPKAHLALVIGALDASYASALTEKSLYTDINGHFECDVFTEYEPSLISVSAVADKTTCSFQEVTVIPLTGLGIISDIDDTIKLTGVVGDKRELMKKLLTGDVQSWRIPAVIDWYRDLLLGCNATFHYVSNSPWQLFALIDQYLDTVELPRGSIHLKQYSGNIIASLMEPSSLRKSKALSKILHDFPLKRFICVGDSGEQDLEAYVDLALANPERIVAIYIRAVPDSFSLIDDSRITGELRWMINDWNERQARKFPVRRSSAIVNDLIDLTDEPPSKVSRDRSSKLPPMVPQKPQSLKSQAVRKLPPLPERRYLQDNTSLRPDNEATEPLPLVKAKTAPAPPPPRRRKVPPELQAELTPELRVPELKESVTVSDLTDSAEKHLKSAYEVDEFFELEEIDSKGAAWIQRIAEALHRLDGTGTKLALFEDEEKDFFKSSLQSVVEESASKSK